MKSGLELGKYGGRCWLKQCTTWELWVKLYLRQSEEKGTTEDEMAGWHHQLDGRESEWIPGDGDGQGGPACCDSCGRKELDTTERLNWTEKWVTATVSFESFPPVTFLERKTGKSQCLAPHKLPNLATSDPASRQEVPAPPRGDVTQCSPRRGPLSERQTWPHRQLPHPPFLLLFLIFLLSNSVLN